MIRILLLMGRCCEVGLLVGFDFVVVGRWLRGVEMCFL